jgi:hypothetical protein
LPHLLQFGEGRIISPRLLLNLAVTPLPPTLFQAEIILEGTDMPLYLVSYDISEKDAFEYDALWAKLREIQAKRILYSEWVVGGDSASAVYNKFAPLIQKKDRLLVQGITQEATWDKLMISDDDFTAFLNGDD